MAINIGQGTIIKATISSTLTVIAQAVEADGPGITVPKIDKTALADVARRYRGGLPDADPLTFTVQYDPTNTTHEALVTMISTFPQTAVAWNVLFNTVGGTDTAVFTGFLTKFHPKGMNQEDNLEADIEVQPDGIPTFS